MALEDLFPALFDGYFIKIIFLVHTLLLFLAESAIGISSSGATYNSYNMLFLLCILLSILVDKNVDIVLVATALNSLCVFFDIIMLIGGLGHDFWSNLFIIMNLIFRPISSILLLKNYSARAGVDDPTSGLLEVAVPAGPPPQARTAYQDIDRPNPNYGVETR